MVYGFSDAKGYTKIELESTVDANSLACSLTFPMKDSR